MSERPHNVPLPGVPVRGSRSGRPIMAALNLLSRRWVLRILWELRAQALGFRELHRRCERMSPDTLSTRLSELEIAGIVRNDGRGTWSLTPIGAQLEPALLALLAWSDDWASALDDERAG